MRQHELRPAPGSRHARKRVGRGDGSGHGTYSGRGQKGQKARSGGRNMRPGFEGGQLPLIKRLPHKRGFTNIFRKEWAIINVGQLSVFPANSEVTPEHLVAAGLVSRGLPVKVLAEGDLHHPITVRANRFSEAAKRKIAAPGGRVEEV